ncbi:DUF3060 domain-containing protein [Dokdonella sp.]|uniref:DUF3060 domain-containing protein n=1 Tax=Dokdonella sp. TaxID=2291710 RepID=UPI00261FDE68|nr:DUF3060 domain-containing protein [Dokdonella sp.]
MQRHSLNAALLCLVLASGANTAAADDDAPLFVNTQEGSVDCDGHDVNVTSSNATLTFTGRCKGIYFIGTGTTATIESAELVQATGAGQRVTAKGKVSEVYLIGRDGQFEFEGVGALHLNGNASRVDAKTIDTIDAAGSRNTVHWSSGKPTINDMGSGNVLKPKS